MASHVCATDDRKLPIDRPCSACSAGDYKMEHHAHCPPFRINSETPQLGTCPRCGSDRPQIRNIVSAVGKFPCYDSYHDAPVPAPTVEAPPSVEEALAKAKIAVQPIIDREAKGENITSEMMDFRMKGMSQPDTFEWLLARHRKLLELEATPGAREERPAPEDLLPPPCSKCGSPGIWKAGAHAENQGQGAEAERFKREHLQGQLDNYQALITKIQKIVTGILGPDTRLADFDVLDQGVAEIARASRTPQSAGGGQ